jgi:hypothetical protein
MQSISTASIVEAIKSSTFIFQEDWERNWSAQPLPGRTYYVGRPKESSGWQYAIQWSPRKRQLSIWTFPDAGTPERVQETRKRRLSVAAARRLTRLIRQKLGTRTAEHSDKKHCVCACSCC